MAKVYVVSGSEDGNIGVYGSAKKAVMAAYDYVRDYQAIGDSGVIRDAVREIRLNGIGFFEYTSYEDGRAFRLDADVKEWELNQ